ncbi:hypothetical protein RDI58_005003 [Solanum bulbocastanum]|uniref:non-specific serine/threonine protein kinase n=1 Tax=Solanum bulbocastanum TaxID=147425 RepID=A0AAN8U6Y6_SOLBU
MYIHFNFFLCMLEKMTSPSYYCTSSFLLITFSLLLIVCEAQNGRGLLPEEEKNALREIGEQLGKTDWDFNVNPCDESTSWTTPGTDDLSVYVSNVTCNCDTPNGSCHVQSMSLMLNQLSGPIPKYLGNMTSLVYMRLESNMFNGTVPKELGDMFNLQVLILSFNNLTGHLPEELNKLTNLKELRLRGNNFTGKLPSFESFKTLQRLEIQASGFKGPIAPVISVSTQMIELRITDLTGGASEFPLLGNMTRLTRLILRNCNISGKIPPYITNMPKLKLLDLSFNKFEGQIPNLESLKKLDFLYLVGNRLTGPIPDWVKSRNSKHMIDLSYNNFSESSEPICQETLNLFRSYNGTKNSELGKCVPRCSKKWYSVRINCGGESVTIGDTVYEADRDSAGAAKFTSSKESWGASNSGYFWDKSITAKDYLANNISAIKGNDSELYTTARLSASSLTYYGRCLANGNYTVTLHFAEIVIRDNRSFQSLGKRIFDVYIQGERKLKDFDIRTDAGGVDKPFTIKFNATVADSTLEVRFQYAGKGTAALPRRGSYGPSVSAISFEANFKPPPDHKKLVLIIAGAVASLLIIIFIISFVAWKRHRSKIAKEEESRGLDSMTGVFTIRQIKAATNNFDAANKIGEGGFGSVYKGTLSDGAVIAVKQLSSKSKQGKREFVNEIGMISSLQHPNLVQLYGCCAERNHLLLVYEYMENNSLARALFGNLSSFFIVLVISQAENKLKVKQVERLLFGPEEHRLKIDWPTRQKICIGIAKGLSFLHEESSLKIVHRDIKATNVLLDKKLNPKISDFGLARLDDDDNNTHITTRVAGTIGYMAPEYALWGYLTYKADVYSFGVLALEIAAGKSNMTYRPNEKFVCLLDWALVLQRQGKLKEVVDATLGSDLNEDEALRMLNVALLCTSPSPALRPTMSAVVKILENHLDLPEFTMESRLYDDYDLLNFQGLRDKKMSALLILHDFSISSFLLILVLCSLVQIIEAQRYSRLLPQQEKNALKEIAEQMGKKDWDFDLNPCNGNTNWTTPKIDKMSMYVNNVTCNCSTPDGFCHVQSILLKGQDLAGVLPPSLVKLPYLKTIDVALNYLSGTIPPEWASIKLEFMSVMVNQLSGPIPKYLGNMTTLLYMSLENNMFNGTVPKELGNMVNLQSLTLSFNNLTGKLPEEVIKLTKLTELRLSGNSFTGILPSFGSLKNLQKLMLRSCNLSGKIPSYIASMPQLKILDLSFNRLEGQIPDLESRDRLELLYLTSNKLTGPIQDWIKSRNSKYVIDLSYNNFNESSMPTTCRETLYVFFPLIFVIGTPAVVISKLHFLLLIRNLFKSYNSTKKSELGKCLSSNDCSKNWYSVHINCGGESVTIGDTTYEADEDSAGAAKFVYWKGSWGSSNTGDFWDRPIALNEYKATNVSSIKGHNSELYMTARLSALSLTYYGRCLANGNYTVTLHFAEIVIRDNRSFQSLGKRMFDVYIQGERKLKDFDIRTAAGGVDEALTRKFNASVEDGILEVRFQYAGKGTTAVPRRGSYGPLVSAISFEANFKPPSNHKKMAHIIAGAVASSLVLLFTIFFVAWWRSRNSISKEEELRRLDLLTGVFTIRQIKAVTNNFDAANKIGEGGFGSVYKGTLLDGTVIAVKQLSSKSKQGNREFVNEIGMISGLQHPNLVKLYGCCAEGNQLLLVYEYLENNSLALGLFGPEEHRLQIDWPTRQKICIGIAKGLAFLHEESSLKIVHRDIKATNVLLDKKLNPKISDFGLAKLDDEDKTHISTRIAGTIGYMAPEYALWGYLTYKADVYSFGVVALEIVAGKNNMKYRPNEKFVCLLDWALVLQKHGKLMELVDETLSSDFKKDEALRMINVALLCTNPSPALRPTMSAVVSILEDHLDLPEFNLESRSHDDELKFQGLREKYDEMRSLSESQTLTHSSNTTRRDCSSTTSESA